MSKSARRRAAKKQFGDTPRSPVALDRKTVTSPAYQKLFHDGMEARMKELLPPDLKNRAPAETTLDPGIPLWLPQGEDLQELPVELRQAIAQFVLPTHEELVVQTPAGMEQNLGASIVYLLWLEVLEQFDFKKEYSCYELQSKLNGDRTQAIDRYLKLLGAKLRVGNFMLRLRELRLKQSREQVPASPSPTPTVQPATGPLPIDKSLAAYFVRSTATSEPASPSSSLEESPSWKNQETLSKTQTPSNQAPKPKTQDQSCTNQETLSNDESFNNQAPSWKNQKVLSKSSHDDLPSVPQKSPQYTNRDLPTKHLTSPNFHTQDLDPEPQGTESWKNPNSAPKNHSSETPNLAEHPTASSSDPDPDPEKSIVETLLNKIKAATEDSKPEREEPSSKFGKSDSC